MLSADTFPAPGSRNIRRFIRLILSRLMRIPVPAQTCRMSAARMTCGAMSGCRNGLSGRADTFWNDRRRSAGHDLPL